MGTQIVQVLNVKLIGYWEDLGKFLFHDPITESSFTAGTIEEATLKLNVMRHLFGKTQPN